MQEKTLLLLQGCPLFAGIAPADVPTMLACLGARQKPLGKHQLLFAAGTAQYTMGVVLAGSVDVVQEDYWGNRSILTRVTPGGLFAEAFAFAGVPRLPVSVVAAPTAEVLLLDTAKVAGGCGAGCTFHARLVQNMLCILAQKNTGLAAKMETITQKTTRQKLLAYLSQQATAAGGARFDIPFNRQQLADYLAVERSAMSAELSRMQADGLLRYHKSSFELLV